MFRLGGSVLRKHQRGFKTEKGKQPVKCVIKPPNWDLGASINQHMPQIQPRGARELGRGWGGGTPRGRGVPRLIPWSFIHSGLPQGTKEDLEAKGDLQAKKHWCKQLEARHMRSHSAKGEDLQPGLLC